VATVLVSCEGYESIKLPLPPGFQPGAAPLVVEMSRGAEVLVRVRDVHGEPAAASIVRLWRDPGTPSAWGAMQSADAQGVALFRDVPTGRIEVSAVRVDGLGANNPGNAPALLSTPIAVQSGERSEVTVTVSSLSKLSGNLWLGRDALSGATISFNPGRRAFDDVGSAMDSFASAPSVRSDERGYFGPVELAPGEYVLLIVHEAFGVRTRRSVVVEQRDTELIIDVDDTAISGVVVDASGDPISGASVELYASDRNWREDLRPEIGEFLIPASDRRRPVSTAVSDGLGNYRLHAVPPGVPLQLLFRLGQRADARPSIHVPLGRTLQNINGRIPDAGSLRVKLSAPLPETGLHYGVRIVGLEQPPGLGLLGAHIAPRGEALFDALPSGPWRVMLFTLDSADVIVERRSPANVQVRSGKETEFSVGW
jgi:hypothetical protein